VFVSMADHGAGENESRFADSAFRVKINYSLFLLLPMRRLLRVRRIFASAGQ